MLIDDSSAHAYLELNKYRLPSEAIYWDIGEGETPSEMYDDSEVEDWGCHWGSKGISKSDGGRSRRHKRRGIVELLYRCEYCG